MPRRSSIYQMTYVSIHCWTDASWLGRVIEARVRGAAEQK
jgi:hypothetical protein